MGKKWGKNCQCRGEEACAAAAERGGLGLNKANGDCCQCHRGRKGCGCLVQRQKMKNKNGGQHKHARDSYGN
jgi:hypothetical protein